MRAEAGAQSKDATRVVSTTEQPVRDHRLRRRLIAAAVVVLVLAALILTPPYLNVNRYRRRIATTMSQSLGRPVHLDNVTLHILPVPGFTLSNLVVSEDPAFGYEPVIRANTVEASVRVSSLWRRHVEFSTIRFIDPSLNLVRNAQGKWNLEDVLMQASHVETAPTAQRTAGPAPRFPYIEASGARVNVKIGNEKKPFSLTEAQFALWLPSPQLWRVRLRGRPTRTDNNVSQTGEMNLEGTLQRAPQMANVPVDLNASWNGAPLGEASRLLTGNDAGWRGTIFVEAHLAGELSTATLTTHLQLNDLRRADYVPAQPLDVSVDCSATSDIARAVLSNANCAAPVGDIKPLMLTTPALDLGKPATSQASIVATKLPLPWLFGWAKLFLADMPPTLEPAGNVDGEVKWNADEHNWQGTATVRLPAAEADVADSTKTMPAEPPQFVFAIDTAPTAAGTLSAPIARLAPTAIHTTTAATLMLAAQADSGGYSTQLSGTATNAQVMNLADMLPPLNRGVAAALPPDGKLPATHAIAVTCTRPWTGEQICAAAAPTGPVKPTRNPKRHR